MKRREFIACYRMADRAARAASGNPDDWLSQQSITGRFQATFGGIFAWT